VYAVDLNKLYDFCVSVAASEARDKDRVVGEIKAFIQSHMVDVDLKK
jgi:hypothetical protein